MLMMLGLVGPGRADDGAHADLVVVSSCHGGGARPS